MMVQASLRGELEANQQQLESLKVGGDFSTQEHLHMCFFVCKSACASLFQIEVCELSAERHRLQEQLRSALEQHQRTSNSLQQRISSLQTERDNTKVHSSSI